jgi:hypothetical protein
MLLEFCVMDERVFVGFQVDLLMSVTEQSKTRVPLAERVERWHNQGEKLLISREDATTDYEGSG